MTDQSYEEFVTSLASNLVAEMAPGGSDSGEAAAALGPVALAVAGEVVAFIVNEIKKTLRQEASGAISAFVKRLLARLRATGGTGPQGALPGAGEADDRGAPPELTPGQLAQIHRLAYETARRLDLSEPEATRLAHAAVGSLTLVGT